MSSRIIITAAAAAFAACGCARKAAPKLLLYCGAGLRKPVAEIAEAFSNEHNVEIECDYAGAAMLLSRAKLSQRGDIYMPGDIQWVRRAENEGIIASKRVACYFVPVILVRKGNPKRIRTLRDLIRPGIRLGLGDPKVIPVGTKAMKVFEKNGISRDDVKKNLVFNSLTVEELGNHIQVGKVDAVIVWDAVAARYTRAGDVIVIPGEENIISTVAVAVLSFSKHKDLAEEFARFVCSKEGRRIFLKHNYTTEEPGG